MSTLPSVISRFVDYYATLDTQPPSALAGFIAPMPRLSIPLANIAGCSRSSAISPTCWLTSSTVALPLMRRCSRAIALWSPDDALVAPAYCPGCSATAAGLLRGRHARRSHCSPAGLLRCRRDDLRTSPDTRLGRTRREAESEIMKTVLITGASSGIGAGWRNLCRRWLPGDCLRARCATSGRCASAQPQHHGAPVRYDRQGRLSPGAGGLCCRHGDSLRRNLRVSRPRRGGCRAGGAGHDHQFHGAGKLPCGVAAATGIRQPRGAGQFDGALASLPASRSLWGL